MSKANESQPFIVVKKIVHGQEVDVKIYASVGPTKSDEQKVK